MKTINVPGFTAEAALFKSGKAYTISRMFYTEHDVVVLPQAPKNPKNDLCKSTCTSILLGDLVTCASDKYPGICKSNAENRNSRCNTRCDNVYTRTDVTFFPPGSGGVLAEAW